MLTGIKCVSFTTSTYALTQTTRTSDMDRLLLSDRPVRLLKYKYRPSLFPWLPLKIHPFVILISSYKNFNQMSNIRSP